MKIQIIQLSQKRIESTHNIEYNYFSNFKSLDLFDVNIIDLQNEEIWKNNSSDLNDVNLTMDFKSLTPLINDSSSMIIVALPLNYKFKYGAGYKNLRSLKDMIQSMENIISPLICKHLKYSSGYSFRLFFENTYTNISGAKVESNFSISNHNINNQIVTNNISNTHSTSIKNGNYYVTSLNIHQCNLDDLLWEFGIEEEKTEYPEWLVNLKRLDDEYQTNIISENNAEIEKRKSSNVVAEEKLRENMDYKSILVTNGDELVRVVFNVLEKILSYDLSGFKDEKKEDFLIKLEDVTFIGEIKGITSNVKSEHISQLDVHLQSYRDNLPDDTTECVKSLLIINPFRTKNISEREPIHENQIKLALRNESLIITTEQLLDLFEKLTRNELSAVEIKEMLKNQTGILKI